MIDVVALERAREARAQVELLERRGGAHEDAEAARALAQALGDRDQRGLPVALDPLPAAAHPGPKQAVAAVDALVAEAGAVGEPGLVDGLVLARHDAHQAPAQHVTE